VSLAQQTWRWIKRFKPVKTAQQTIFLDPPPDMFEILKLELVPCLFWIPRPFLYAEWILISQIHIFHRHHKNKQRFDRRRLMLAPRKSRRLTGSGFIKGTNEHAFGRCYSLSFDAPQFIADVQSRLNQRQASHFLSAVDSDKKRRGEPAHFSRFGASSPVGSPNFATKKASCCCLLLIVQ
jgi:hypothetical protein